MLLLATDIDIANNMNRINTIRSPCDTLSDFLQNLYQRNIKIMKRKTVKVTAGPTMSPTLFAPDADARFLDAVKLLFGIFLFKVINTKHLLNSSSHFKVFQSLKHVTDRDPRLTRRNRVREEKEVPGRD